MFGTNPFGVAGQALPAGFLQGFLVVMVVAVIVGVLFDIVHKGLRKYFFGNLGKSAVAAAPLGGQLC